MQKIIFFLGAMLLTVNCYAVDISNLASALQTPSSNQHQSSAIIYVGQDLSHQQIAIANESVWSQEKIIV